MTHPLRPSRVECAATAEAVGAQRTSARDYAAAGAPFNTDGAAQ